MEDIKNQLLTENKIRKSKVKINWGRQGSVILAYIIILLGYFGIVANVAMVNEVGEYISFTEMVT